jgi:hypothetical protein
VQVVVGLSMHPPQDENRSDEGGEDSQGPKEGPNAQTHEAEREYDWQGIRGVAHEKYTISFGEARGLLNLLHGGSVVRVRVVDELLACGPKTDEIARCRDFSGEGDNAKEHGGECKREPGNGRNRELDEVDWRLRPWKVGACHEGYSTFRSGGRRGALQAESLDGNFLTPKTQAV